MEKFEREKEIFDRITFEHEVTIELLDLAIPAHEWSRDCTGMVRFSSRFCILHWLFFLRYCLQIHLKEKRRRFSIWKRISVWLTLSILFLNHHHWNILFLLFFQMKEWMIYQHSFCLFVHAWKILLLAELINELDTATNLSMYRSDICAIQLVSTWLNHVFFSNVSLLVIAKKLKQYELIHTHTHTRVKLITIYSSSSEVYFFPLRTYMKLTGWSPSSRASTALLWAVFFFLAILRRNSTLMIRCLLVCKIFFLASVDESA